MPLSKLKIVQDVRIFDTDVIQIDKPTLIFFLTLFLLHQLKTQLKYSQT